MFLNYLKPTNVRHMPHYRIEDEEDIFKKYGQIKYVSLKSSYAFIEFFD